MINAIKWILTDLNKIEIEFFNIRNNPKYPCLEIRNSRLNTVKRNIIKKKLINSRIVKQNHIKFRKIEEQPSWSTNNEEGSLSPIYS